MTIWCQGTLDAEVYFLYKEGSHSTWSTETLQKPRNKGKFFYPSVTGEHAGKYCCYWYSSAGWSEPSDILELVVTGKETDRFPTLGSDLKNIPFSQSGLREYCDCVRTCTKLLPPLLGIYDYKELRLSVLPSPVVTVGRNMTLHCVSHSHYDKFILTKEDHKFTSSLDTQCIPPSGQCQALFVMGPMTSNHTGTFRCYGYYKNSPQLWSVPSKPLEIHISGLSKKPSLLTHQGHILDPGVNLTLQCCSDINYDRFALYKVGGADIMQHTSQWTDTGFSMTNFTLGYVNPSTGGQYRCYGAHDLSSEWSASSDPLDILITGQIDDTPSLSVMPNSSVHSGENVTLMCWSTYFVDTFILSKEGSGQPLLRLKSKFQDQQYQSEFSMSDVTSTHSGTYRCYGSRDSSLYLLSFASAPVELRVSGPIRMSTLPPITSMPPDHKYQAPLCREYAPTPGCTSKASFLSYFSL